MMELDKIELTFKSGPHLLIKWSYLIEGSVCLYVLEKY